MSDVEIASPTHSVDLLFHGQGRVTGDTKACKGDPTRHLMPKTLGVLIIISKAGGVLIFMSKAWSSCVRLNVF